MFFILFQLLIAYGKRNRVNAEAGIEVSRIQLDVVNAHAEFSDSGGEIIEVGFIFEFQMDLEVIGFVFEVLFYSREERETAEQSDIGYQRNGV